MRIAYLSQMADVSFENGIAKKIRAQILAWLAAGHSVRYFALTPSATVWPGFAPVETTVIPRGGFVARHFRAVKLTASIQQWRPDVIYYRYGHHLPGLPALFRAIPAVAEVNSDDLREYPLQFPLRKQIYHRLTRGWTLRAVSGFVTVTAELGERFRSFGQPIFALGNSIALNEYTPLPPAMPDQGQHVVFLGSPSAPWHGLDRIAELARLLPEWTFDMVGSTAVEARNIPGGGPAPNQIFHGYLGQATYGRLLAASTAALGTFALWRNHMHEASPLKVREYLARGLPVIAAYRDTDIAAEADYFLRLPNDGAALHPHRSAIHSFLARWQGRRVPRDAVKHLDTDGKERARLQFLSEVHACRQQR